MLTTLKRWSYSKPPSGMTGVTGVLRVLVLGNGGNLNINKFNLVTYPYENEGLMLWLQLWKGLKTLNFCSYGRKPWIPSPQLFQTLREKMFWGDVFYQFVINLPNSFVMGSSPPPPPAPPINVAVYFTPSLTK